MNASPLLKVRRSLRTRISAIVAAALPIIAPIARGFDSTPYPDATAPDGSASHPWKVNQPQDFDLIGTDGVHLANQSYLLTTDLDFGDQDHRCRVNFGGNFDGDYHVISRIRIDTPANSYVCLFRSLNVGATIRRLAIQNSYFRGHSWVAPIVGSLQKESVVQECHSRGNTVIAATAQAAGGIVSSASYESPSAVVRNSFARDNIISCPHQTVGGISGYHDARVEFCYTAGNTLTAPWYVGGIVGYGVGTGSIAYCYSDKTNAPSWQTGGFNGSWVNALVPDRNTSGFDITGRSIAELNWDPAVWSIGPDGYPWLTGFNLPPVANAGTAQSVPLGSAAHLDASASSDDHTPPGRLGLIWSLESAPTGSTAILTGTDSPHPVFTPDLSGDYAFKLVVTDENGLTGTANTTVSARNLFENGGVENGFTEWGAAGNVGIESGLPYVPTDGSSLIAFNAVDRPPNGEVSHLVRTIPGQAYLLEFDVGTLSYNTGEQRLEVNVIGNANVLSETIALRGIGGGGNHWTNKSYVFIADSPLMTVFFMDRSNTTRSIDLLLDHVRVTCTARTILVSSVPAYGATISVTPADTLGESTGGTVFRRTYNPGTLVELGAPAETGGGAFHCWFKNGVFLSFDPDIEITIDGDHQLTALYRNGEPIITEQPQNATAIIGGTAVFRVSASGAVPLSYQWKHEGNDIIGANDARLVINPVESGSIGSYQVEVSNSLGSVTSDEVILSAGPFFAGLENGGFEADFLGWTTGGNVRIQSAPPYAPAEGVKLVAFNSGNANATGVLSQSFATTPGQPYLLGFDIGTLAYNRHTQGIEVVVTGSPSLMARTFTLTGAGNGGCVWENHTLPFTADSSLTTVTFRDISPATNAIDLLLDNVMVTPRILKTLTVSTEIHGGIVVYPDEVTVSPPDYYGTADGTPVFTRQYLAGETVTLTAPATQHFYGPGYSQTFLFRKWLLDGADHTTSLSCSVSLSENHVMTCVYDYSSPSITEQPSDVAATPGTRVTFHVAGQIQYIGETLSYQWRFNGTDITGAVTDTLTIPAVTGAHAGDYDVLVSNAGGSTTSRAARLTVIANPLVNGSFESGLAGWSEGGNVRNQAGSPAPDGGRIVAFNAGNSVPNGSLSQTFVTVPGEYYALRFELGILSYIVGWQEMRVSANGAWEAAAQTYRISRNTYAEPVTRWETKNLNFVANSPTTTLVFRDVSVTTNGLDLLLDHIRLVPLNTLWVSTLSDENDTAPGLGSGESLREVLAAAAASGNPDLIRFVPALDAGMLVLGGTQLTVNCDVAIDASSLPGGITISGDSRSRVFEILPGRVVSMKRLTITGGSGMYEDGAGILNNGSLDLMESSVTGNSITVFIPGFNKGGGICNSGVLHLAATTVSSNAVGSAATGGGIYNDGTTVIVNSTISGNSAVFGPGGLDNRGSATLRNVTISENHALYNNPGGLRNWGALTLENSIIAYNWNINYPYPFDIGGDVTTSLGVNLIDINPMLAPLGNHGGATQTMLPMTGSPAIDAAMMLPSTPPHDQRGASRPQGTAPDIGAVESN